ncbi:MAG: class I SAM-dependent methyltransferase [Candidatus Promineifilaceae bacterium]|nr:class I SAM-dependent methyltransferase [Candidatus Promineifilaceae bacterium]
MVERMYGSETTDWLVRYYDEAFAAESDNDVAWYLSQSQRYGGPVLDLACGTGRLALALARAGLAVTGVDQSAGMLARFKSKLAAEPESVRQRVTVVRQPMADFSLAQPFSTIVCCDAFFHNLTVQEQLGCLRSVADHLTPTGRFLFNVPFPTCDFIQESIRSAGQSFSERGRYPLPDGGQLLVEQAQAGDRLKQTITTTLRFTRYDAREEEIERGRSSWKSRYIYRYEAIHLLARSGLMVEKLVGDYQDGPVTVGGQLIFQVRLASA